MRGAGPEGPQVNGCVARMRARASDSSIGVFVSLVQYRVDQVV